MKSKSLKGTVIPFMDVPEGNVVSSVIRNGLKDAMLSWIVESCSQHKPR